MSAEDECRDVLHADFQFIGNESAEASRVQDSRHANDALAREAAQFKGSLRHRIERIRHDDQDAVWRILHHFPNHRFHDVVVGVEQVVAAHARLARDARRDDHDVRVRSVFVIVGAADVGITLLNRHGFEQIETLPLRHALNDVDKNHVREFFTRNPVSRSCAYVAGSDDCYFLPHESFPFRIVQLGNLVMSS